MASLFGHAATALTIGRIAGGSGLSARKAAKTPEATWVFWALLVACATAADLDVIGFSLGVPYPADWGHRGLTHSLVSAVVMARVAAVVSTRVRRVPLNSSMGLRHFGVFLAAAASHPLLDMLTNGGLGIAVFWPFDCRRYFLPYRPIEVSPLGAGAFFSARGLGVLSSEFTFIYLPCILALAVAGVSKVSWKLRRLARS
jgi:inner membrane protein